MEGVSVVVVFDIDAENSRIAFATSWTTAGPREDNRDRFHDRRDGGGDEETVRLTREARDETLLVVVTCTYREQNKHVANPQAI